MPQTYIRIQGANEVRQRLVALSAGCAAVGNARILIQSRVPYAFGIETGFFRNGRLARRAGGARMLERAYKEVLPGMTRSLFKALDTSPQDTIAALNDIVEQIIERASEYSPKVSGDLSESFYASGGRVVAPGITQSMRGTTGGYSSEGGRVYGI